jgi:hypothetical protein
MASSRSRTDATQRSSPASAASPETRTTGTSSPGTRSGQQLADLELDELRDLLVGRVGLVERDDDVRHPHLPGEHDVLRVCGITPSSAETTRTAPSTCAAPVIMFFT